MIPDEGFIHLDLYSGLQGWRTGKEVAYVGIDNDPQFDNTITKDMRRVTLTDISYAFGDKWLKYPLLITNSTVCTGFTVMQIGRNWNKCADTGMLTPKSDTARLGLDLLHRSMALIQAIQAMYPLPVYWVLENPRAAMRKMPIVQDLNRVTVTYCQYGEDRQKPTDLWSCDHLFNNVEWREPCKRGSPCHTPAPRGSYTGTQGMSKAESAKIPLELAESIVKAIT
jgi:hypothetical protein